MLFRTELNPDKSKIDLKYKSKIILIGSCFSDNIGEKLDFLEFNTLINPFGTVYNVASICKLLKFTCSLETPSETHFAFEQGIHSHYDFHASFSSKDLSTLRSNIKASIERTYKYLLKSDILFITLGTSWTYVFNETSDIISNCQKRPQKLFSKKLLNEAETTKYLNEMIEICKSINPAINICFTVSPVRHIKDGIVNNAISKARLHTSIHKVVSEMENCHYFPAFEIMMDDLRDYRFYKEDLIHPNQQAIDYIWEKFSLCFFSEKTLHTMAKIEKCKRILGHKSLVDDEQHIIMVAEANEALANIRREELDQ